SRSPERRITAGYGSLKTSSEWSCLTLHAPLGMLGIENLTLISSSFGFSDLISRLPKSHDNIARKNAFSIRRPDTIGSLNPVVTSHLPIPDSRIITSPPLLARREGRMLGVGGFNRKCMRGC
ncbi:hypothetical protein SK128_020893, partial [Halocaridina rubra]